MTNTEQRTQINHVPDQKTEDQKTAEVYRNILKELLLPMFNGWFNSLDVEGELAKLPAKVIAESYGCAESSGFAMMFMGFAAGALAVLFDHGEDEAARE